MPDSGIEAVYAGRARRVVAGVCGVEGLALLGFCVFYAWELAHGSGDDTVRVVMSIVLMVVVAAGLLGLAVFWRRGAGWPVTPTVVWNGLLLPVAWGLLQSGRGAVATVVGVVALVGIVAALGAREELVEGDELAEGEERG